MDGSPTRHPTGSGTQQTGSLSLQTGNPSLEAGSVPLETGGANIQQTESEQTQQTGSLQFRFSGSSTSASIHPPQRPMGDTGSRSTPRDALSVWRIETEARDSGSHHCCAPGGDTNSRRHGHVVCGVPLFLLGVVTVALTTLVATLLLGSAASSRRMCSPERGSDVSRSDWTTVRKPSRISMGSAGSGCSSVTAHAWGVTSPAGCITQRCTRPWACAFRWGASSLRPCSF